MSNLESNTNLEDVTDLIGVSPTFPTTLTEKNASPTFPEAQNNNKEYRPA